MHLRFLALLALPLAVLTAQVSIWTNDEGRTMEAECLGRSGATVTFRKADGTQYNYPYARLSAADQARVDALPPAPPQPPRPASDQATPAGIPKEIARQLVSVRGKTLQHHVAQKTEIRYLAYYYSALWCGPCRAFTPKLVEAYKELKAARPDFELIFVSSDRSEDSMAEYMTKYGMSFPAVKYSMIDTLAGLRRPDHERGIPNLVFLTADGKELATSYSPDGTYTGPSRVLEKIRQTLSGPAPR